MGPQITLIYLKLKMTKIEISKYAQCHPPAVLPVSIVNYLILNHCWHFPHDLDSFEIIGIPPYRHPLHGPWICRTHCLRLAFHSDLLRGNPLGWGYFWTGLHRTPHNSRVSIPWLSCA